MVFDDVVSAMAKDLIEALDNVPAWRQDFPIVEPPPLEEVKLTRPILVSAT
jgi:hypothetical protein